MAYDEKLASRIRKLLKYKKNSNEKKMFGGLAFMLNGSMCSGIIQNLLVARVGPDNYESALREPHTRPMDFTGRPMKGYVYVEPDGYESDEQVTFTGSSRDY
jgi:hypothetical protein